MQPSDDAIQSDKTINEKVKNIETSTQKVCINYLKLLGTSSSAMAERQREFGDFKRVGHFEVTF